MGGQLDEWTVCTWTDRVDRKWQHTIVRYISHPILTRTLVYLSDLSPKTMELNPGDPNTSSAKQEQLRILQYPTVHYCVRNSPSFVLRRWNPAHALPSYSNSVLMISAHVYRFVPRVHFRLYPPKPPYVPHDSHISFALV